MYALLLCLGCLPLCMTIEHYLRILGFPRHFHIYLFLSFDPTTIQQGTLFSHVRKLRFRKVK